MKKHNIIIAAMAVLMTGCAEELIDNEFPANEIQVTAGFPATKTTFVSGDNVTRVEWTRNDAISLFAEDQSDLRYEAENGGARTQFRPADTELRAGNGAQIYGFYPAGSVSKIYSDQYFFDITTPTFIAEYKEDYCDNYLMYAVSTVTDGQLSLEFKHLFAYLRLTIPVEMIADRGENGGLVISSTVPMAVDYNGKTVYPDAGYINEDDRGSTSIYYHIPADIGNKEEITCYIAILPMNAGADVEICPYFSDGSEGVPFITKAVPAGGFKAGRMYSLNLQESEADIKEEEIRNALIALYESTNGDSWTENTNWCSELPIEEWYGIDYYRDIDHLQVLLYDNNLTGEIPSEIFDLENLYILDLDFNEIGGTIPSNIGNCPNLENLYLGYNNLTGGIPESIGNLSNLRTLSLQYNELTGNLPKSIGNLNSLTSFQAAGNYLSGNLPEEYATVMNSDYASIAYNQFYGKIPEAVLEHPNWKYMWTDILNRDNQDGRSFETDGIYIPAPEFDHTDIYGNSLSSADEYRNNTYTIFFHWATWCGYSKPYEKKLRENYDKYKKYGVEVIGWNTFDYEEDFTSYMNSDPVPWKHFKFVFRLNDYVNHTPFIAVADQYGEIVFNSLIDNRDKLWTFLDEELGVEPDVPENPDKPYGTEIDGFNDPENGVIVLQEATLGNGVDLFIMGDGFSGTEKNFGENGKYDRVMRQAYEDFFSIEPYTALQPYFNVYYIKAVSPDEHDAVPDPYNGATQGTAQTTFSTVFEVGTTSITGNHDEVFRYAQQAIRAKGGPGGTPVTDEDEIYSRAMTTLSMVMVNVGAYAGTCWTWWYTQIYNDYLDAPSIAYTSLDEVYGYSRFTTIHEGGGHGFGKLADEYDGWVFQQFSTSEWSKLANNHDIGML